MQGSQLTFDFAVCVLSEYDDDGHLGVAIDHYGEENASGGMAEAILPFGLMSRPLDPDTESDASPTSGCSMLMLSEGSTTSAMPLIDARVTALLPKLRPGGSGIYCGAGNYFLFDGIDVKDPTKRAGSCYIGVKYGTGSAKKSHGLHMVCRTEGDEYVWLTHGYGQGLMMTAGGSAVLKNKAGTAYVEACDAGLNIAGDVSAQGSWRVGEPGSAESVAFNAALVEHQTNTDSRISAAQAELDAISASITALATQTAALSAGLVAVAGIAGPVGPGHVAAAAAAAAAVGAENANAALGPAAISSNKAAVSSPAKPAIGTKQLLAT